MKILALEFSSPRRSVAVLDGATILAESSELAGENLPPLQMVEQALKIAHLEHNQIECIAVGLGPGSYTGIRGAIAMAQGWQLVVGVKLTGTSSADCIAAQAQAEGMVGAVNVVIDAQKGEFYLSRYEITDKSINTTSDLKIVTLTELKSKVTSENPLIGPEIARWFPAGRVVFPTGAVLGRFASGAKEFISGEKLEPIYLRATTFVKAAPPRIIPTL